MSEWQSRILNHPVSDTLAQLERALDGIDVTTDSPSEVVSDIDRLHQIVRHARAVLESVDPVLVSPAMLKSWNNTLGPVVQEVNQYIANGNRGHLVNANNHADGFLPHLYQLPALSPDSQMDGLRETISSFRSMASQYLASLEEEKASLQSELNSLKTKIDEVTNEVTAQKGRLDTAIAEFQQQFSQAESQRRDEFSQTIEKGEAEVTQAIEAEKKQIATVLEKVQQDTTSLSEKSTEKFDALAQETRQSAAELIEELTVLRDKAQELLHVIGSTGMAGEYQKAARSARKSVWLWQGIGVVALIGLIAFAVAAFVPTLNVGFDWGSVGTRAFVAITFGILAAFAIRQSDRYLESEQRNRRYQLELSSIDPYLVGLPEETQHEVKVKLAEKLFGNAAVAPAGKGKDQTGTSLDAIRVALETIQELVQKK